MHSSDVRTAKAAMMHEMAKIEWMIDRKERIVRADTVPSHRENVSLTVCCPEYGWMDSRLTIGADVFSIRLSDTYSPFLKFIAWIDLIIADRPCEPVMVDDEFSEHYFNAVKTGTGDDLLFEYLRFTSPGGGVYRKAVVEKRQLVIEFYWVLSYLMSIDFGNEHKEDSTTVWFNFDPCSDEVIKFDLSKIECYLNS